MNSGEKRILFSFNGFLVEVQSLVKQENKSKATPLLMNPGNHAKILGRDWKMLGVSLPRGPVTGETACNDLGHKEALCVVNLCSRVEIIMPVRLYYKEALLILYIVKNWVG